MKTAVALALALALLGAPEALAVPAAPEALAVPAAPEVVDLQAVVRLAREAGPRLAPEREQVAGAEARRLVAGAYPNPTVSYGGYLAAGGEDTIFTGTRQEDLALEAPLELPGARAARLEAAEKGLEAARARLTAAGAGVAGEAASAFVALQAAQERRAVLGAGLAELERVLAVVRARQAAGAASRYDVMRVELELAGWRTQVAEAEAAHADRQGALAVVLGFPGWRPRAAGSLRPLAVAPPTADEAAGLPAVLAARREEAAALAGVDVARWNRFPALALSLGRSWTTDPFGAAHVAALAVELPVFDTRRGEVAVAEAEAREAAARRALTSAEVAAGFDRLARVAERRRQALERFERETGRRLGELDRFAEAAYKLGRSSLLEWLDAIRTRHELRAARVDLVAGLVEAQVGLLTLRGFP